MPLYSARFPLKTQGIPKTTYNILSNILFSTCWCVFSYYNFINIKLSDCRMEHSLPSASSMNRIKAMRCNVIPFHRWCRERGSTRLQQRSWCSRVPGIYNSTGGSCHCLASEQTNTKLHHKTWQQDDTIFKTELDAFSSSTTYNLSAIKHFMCSTFIQFLPISCQN